MQPLRPIKTFFSISAIGTTSRGAGFSKYQAAFFYLYLFRRTLTHLINQTIQKQLIESKIQERKDPKNFQRGLFMNEYERYGDYSQQARETQNGTGTGKAITFLLIGAGIGAAAALLFTPVSGSELRSSISRGCRSTLDGISQGTQRLREGGSKLLGFNRWRNNRGEEYKQG